MNRLLLIFMAVVTLPVAGIASLAPTPMPVHAAPTATRCYTNQLTLKPVISSGATGHIGVLFRFHNRSHRPCSLYGFPGAQLLAASGKALPTHMQWGDGYISGIQRKKTLVRMDPGANSYFVMEWTHIPSPGQQCPVAPRIRITPPNTYTSILVRMGSYGIDACGGILDVTPVSATRFPI